MKKYFLFGKNILFLLFIEFVKNIFRVMAHHKSALKRIRQTKVRRLYNRLNKRAMKLAIREVRESKQFETAWEKFQKATRVLDKVCSKGIIHKNNAANKKSALAKYVNSLKAKTA